MQESADASHMWGLTVSRAIGDYDINHGAATKLPGISPEADVTCTEIGSAQPSHATPCSLLIPPDSDSNLILRRILRK